MSPLLGGETERGKLHYPFRQLPPPQEGEKKKK